MQRDSKSAYTVTKSVATMMAKFEDALHNHLDDHVDEMVVHSLVRYYDVMECNGQGDEFECDICPAIRRVLQDYMTTDEFERWAASVAGGKDE